VSKKNLGCKGLVLFHGAGANKDHETLVAIENMLTIPVFRHNFPYRDKKPVGPSGPNSMKVLVETVNNAVKQAADELGVATNQIAVGGRSLGGRAASVAAAEGLEVYGLVLLSYPLHPPGKPEKLRTEHFPQIACPTLIIQGETDPFGKPKEVEAHTKAIAGKVAIKPIKGAHSPKNNDSEIVKLIADWLPSP